MVLRLIEEGRPLDEVVFYDTGMEFDSIYRVRDTLIPILESKGIRYTELHPVRPFLYDMLEKPICSRNGQTKYGFGWCGGACRWHTGEKLRAIRRHLSGYDEDVTVYVGIAADELHRAQRNREKGKEYPLIEWGMTEADCLSYCREKGFAWIQGDIDLYDILDRVSCWCCRNKNQRELYHVWKYLPDYWQGLLKLQAMIGEPMKRYCSEKEGFYGDLFRMEEVFRREETGA